MKIFVALALCLAMAAGLPLQMTINEGSQDRHHDCESLRQAGYTQNGTYHVHIDGTWLKTHCKFTVDKAFMIFLYRTDNYVDWDLTIDKYATGFGDPLHDYFMGLNQLNYLTTHYNYGLEVAFMSWSQIEEWSRYNTFRVGARPNYTLKIGGPTTGTVGADLLYNNNAPFYARYREDSHGCVSKLSAGWWYAYGNEGCTKALPTGHYYDKESGSSTPFENGIFWESYMNKKYSVRRLAMYLVRRTSGNEQ